LEIQSDVTEIKLALLGNPLSGEKVSRKDWFFDHLKWTSGQIVRLLVREKQNGLCRVQLVALTVIGAGISYCLVL
jgi:hypothetical protein